MDNAGHDEGQHEARDPPSKAASQAKPAAAIAPGPRKPGLSSGDAAWAAPTPVRTMDATTASPATMLRPSDVVTVFLLVIALPSNTMGLSWIGCGDVERGRATGR